MDSDGGIRELLKGCVGATDNFAALKQLNKILNMIVPEQSEEHQSSINAVIYAICNGAEEFEFNQQAVKAAQEF